MQATSCSIKTGVINKTVEIKANFSGALQFAKRNWSQCWPCICRAKYAKNCIPHLTELQRNPPRPCASRRVDASNQHQTLQTSKTSNKPTRGRVYPPPTPSQTVRLAQLQTFPNGGAAPSKAKYVGKICICCLWAPPDPYTCISYAQSDPQCPHVS